MRSVFDLFALPFILRPDVEGGYVNDPEDPGGFTNFGVTQDVYDAYRLSRHASVQTVKLITSDEVRLLYWQRYWNEINGDLLPAKVAMVLFDCAVNQGPGYAKKLLQWALKVPQDGLLGPKTFAAVASCNADVLGEDLLWARVGRYLALCRAWRSKQRTDPGNYKGPKDPYKYIDGWYGRLDKLREHIRVFHG